MSAKLRLFEGFGIELEYMIVERDTLRVLPVADKLIFDEVGDYNEDVTRGDAAWSNELALHVIELKTNGPKSTLQNLSALFAGEVAHINDLLDRHHGKLLPTGMHPLMDPFKETMLWPHDYNPVYEAFNRIFDCRGHGWSNLQSMHINLPFGNDDEFGRLHAAIRLILPLLPALAASTPVMDGKVTGFLDNRLAVYRNNSSKVPSMTGSVIPEAVFTQRDYEQNILQRIYSDLQQYDPEGTLRYEWSNARGAIARFDRDAIEIRVIDVQECPKADLAIAEIVVAVLRMLVSEQWGTYREQQSFDEVRLDRVFRSTTEQGGDARIDDMEYLRTFGVTQTVRASDLWKDLLERVKVSDEARRVLTVITREGPLAKRIVRALGGDPAPVKIEEVYEKLAGCLGRNELFQ